MAEHYRSIESLLNGKHHTVNGPIYLSVCSWVYYRENPNSLQLMKSAMDHLNPLSGVWRLKLGSLLWKVDLEDRQLIQNTPVSFVRLKKFANTIFQCVDATGCFDSGIQASKPGLLILLSQILPSAGFHQEVQSEIQRDQNSGTELLCDWLEWTFDEWLRLSTLDTNTSKREQIEWTVEMDNHLRSTYEACLKQSPLFSPHLRLFAPSRIFLQVAREAKRTWSKAIKPFQQGHKPLRDAPEKITSSSGEEAIMKSEEQDGSCRRSSKDYSVADDDSETASNTHEDTRADSVEPAKAPWPDSESETLQRLMVLIKKESVPTRQQQPRIEKQPNLELKDILDAVFEAIALLRQIAPTDAGKCEPQKQEVARQTPCDSVESDFTVAEYLTLTPPSQPIPEPDSEYEEVEHKSYTHLFLYFILIVCFNFLLAPGPFSLGSSSLCRYSTFSLPLLAIVLARRNNLLELIDSCFATACSLSIPARKGILLATHTLPRSIDRLRRIVISEGIWINGKISGKEKHSMLAREYSSILTRLPWVESEPDVDEGKVRIRWTCVRFQPFVCNCCGAQSLQASRNVELTCMTTS